MIGKTETRRDSIKGKRSRAQKKTLLVLILAVSIGFFCTHWAWKYYGLTDRTCIKENKSVEKRAKAAMDFAKRHNMNEHYVLLVDYSIQSGRPRMFVWDINQRKIIASTYVMHGSGGGSTAKKPHFSNSPGSECSTLGNFLVTREHGIRLKRSLRLKGMDRDNQTAYARGLMIHGSKWVDIWCWNEYIPLNRESCMGCFTVSTKGMDALWTLVNKEEKPLLLWAFDNK